MISKILEDLNKRYQSKAVDCGEFKTCKISPIRFDIEAYDLEGFGRVSVMKGKALFGLMKMDTVMICPKFIDAPIVSYDRIKAMGNDTAIIEIYDTLINRESFVERPFEDLNASYDRLPKYETAPAWSDDIKFKCSLAKKVKKNDSPAVEEYLSKYIDLLFESFEKAEKCDPAAKNDKNSEYVEALLKNGGVATDKFKQKMGQEKTNTLFRDILWGTSK